MSRPNHLKTLETKYARLKGYYFHIEREAEDYDGAELVDKQLARGTAYSGLVSEQLQQDDAERKCVCARRHFAAVDELRRHVPASAG